MGSMNLLLVIITAIVFETHECGALQSGCSEPEERCVPILHCPTVFNRIHKGELSWNAKFKKHVQSKICEPVERMIQKKHICCTKSSIECTLNSERGVCLLREECPLLQRTTERKLMKSAEQNLCYVHDAKNYFCCTGPSCNHHKKSCKVQQVVPTTTSSPSLHPSHWNDNGNMRGSLRMECNDPDERYVPTRLCKMRSNRNRKGEPKRNNEHNNICCKKNHIECQLNGERGACLLREECPLLRNTTEQVLMKSAEKNLCYVHDSKKYFCCTDPHCTHIKTLCEKKEVVLTNPSLFPSCDRRVAGVLVPKALCSDRSRIIKHASNHQVCCSPPADPYLLIRHRNAAKLADTQCGTVDYQYKIQNGEYAQRGEFPWMARLVYKRRLFCSGTLIHPKYVLTAKHCFRHNPVSVRLGVHNILEHPEHEQQISVAEKIGNPVQDIGLLRLVKPATLEGSFVRPICLPVYESLRLYLPSTVTITGWGLTVKGQPVNVLMKADTQVLIKNDAQCQKDQICTGGRNQNNHCNGDSGGPYQTLSTYGNKKRFVQYGVISHGPADCSNPTHFSRGVLVAYFMDWILENMVL